VSYQVRVRARGRAGGKTANGAWSKPKTTVRLKQLELMLSMISSARR